MAGLLLLGSTAFAQTIWDGGSIANSNWTTNNNWNNNTAPGNPSGSVLTFAGSTRLTPNMNANWTVNGINFAAGAGTFVLGSTGGFTLTIGSSSGIVNLDDTLQTISNAVTLGAAQTWTTGAGSGNLTVSGNINTAGFLLSTNPSTNAARVITLSGAISGTGGLAVGGLGSTTLSGASANTFSGTTTVNSGTLTLSKTAGVTSIAGNIVIGDGAGTDTLRATTANQISSTSQMTFTAGGTAAVFNMSNVNQTVGSISAADSTASITLGTGTLTVGGANVDTGFAGAIQGGTGGVTKTGTGTLTLSGTNTYTGITAVNAGTLAISSEANLGANPGAFNAAQLTLNGGTLKTTTTFAIDDTNRGITVGASGGTISTDAGTTLTVSNAVAGSGSLNKSDTGNILLTASSGSFTGAVNINAGTATVTNSNALGGGTAATTVASGAALALQGGIGIAKGTLFLAGTGVSNSGALINSSGSNSWNGNITLTADATIKTNSAGTDSLNLGTFQPLLSRPPVDATTTSLGSNTLTLTGGTGASEIYLNGRITGTGGLVVNMNNPGDSVVLASHLNTFTGTTQIKQGTLVPATLPNTYPYDNSAGGGTDQYYGLNGPITIGDGTGAANSAVLQILDSGTRFQELINHTVPITLFRDGKFEVGSAQSIGTTDAQINPLGQSLIFNGGNVSIGTNGLLYLAGDVKVNATAGETAVIDGVGNTLSLTIHKGALNNPPNANRTFDVVGGVGNTSDLTINATIKNGSLTKTGAGTMTITGNNTSGYEGTTTINNGILAITNSGALGQGLTNNASATTVNSGGTLQFSNNISVANEWLRLNGTGFGGNGALQNLSGNNAWTNSVFLDSDARIQSQAGTLTLSGTVTSASNANLEVRGSGHTTISGAIGTGTGGLTKEGTGTLTLSGTNTYGGATAINQGVVSLQSSSGLGSAGTGTTVASGAELQLNNTAIGGGANSLTTLAESLTISGTGVSGQGALRSVSGPNVFAGPVTIGSGGALISANSGHSLTLSGGTVTTNQNLTIGTVTENGNVTISGDMANGSGGLIKNGTGSLTIASGTTQTATVGRVQLNAGTLHVGNGSNSNTLNASEFDAIAGTTLTIASAGMVNVTQAAGVTSSFAGALAGNGGFNFTGANSTSVLAFTNAFSAPNLTLTLGGGTLSLATVGGGQFEFGTIHITGDTILDFNNSAGTWLRSALLVIEGGVTITVKGWAAVADNPGASTIWYATTSINAGTISGMDQVGGTPLNQISFENWDSNTFQTTWVSGNHDGWFDREIRPTPEPATYGTLLLSGCLGLLGWRRYRSRKKAAGA